MKARIVKCKANRLREAFGTRSCSINLDTQLLHKVTGPIGPDTISDTAADLLDVASAIYRCERLLKVPGTTNRYTDYEISMPLRDPKPWAAATDMLADALKFLGNAKWTFDFEKAPAEACAFKPSADGNAKDQVVLFSGGLDSTCGLATCAGRSIGLILSSYYTRQKRKQAAIALQLGFESHVQWTLPPLSGPGRSFFYRSFYFLSLAAVVAKSWGIRRLTQFETGILAYAIAPSPWYAMTKHAHPKYLAVVAQLYEQLFGDGPWTIENPFIHFTKREEVDCATKRLGAEAAQKLFAETETCWSHWACHVHGVEKRPGMACGVCIPCIIRRTALPDDTFRVDLTKRHLQNDEKMGQAFRSYLAFLDGIVKSRSVDRFYTLLPTHVRELVSPPNDAELIAVHRLFLRFAKEFFDTFF